MKQDISNSDNIIDSRDVIKRIEELEDAKEVFNDTLQEWKDEKEELEKDTKENHLSEVLEIIEKITKWGTWEESEEGEELKNLLDFQSEFEGYCTDWKYRTTLIRDSYWEEFCKEELEEFGYVPKDFPSWIEIDYKETAENMQQDYTSGELDGVTYWAR
jgi:hypothetical protein